MITNATRRKFEKFWGEKCAICGNNDFLKIHHLTERAIGGGNNLESRKADFSGLFC